MPEQQQRKVADLLHTELANDTNAAIALDISDLTRTIKEFTRQQQSAQDNAVQAQQKATASIKGYIAATFAVIIALAVFTFCSSPYFSRLIRTDSDKGAQISSCQLETMRTFPQQNGPQSLQFFNLCMTSSGYTPNYDCDTTTGIPAYKTACWINKIW
jgi:hypothetical protein